MSYPLEKKFLLLTAKPPANTSPVSGQHVPTLEIGIWEKKFFRGPSPSGPQESFPSRGQRDGLLGPQEAWHPPRVRSNYEIFFYCNNFNIRYWSWDYRGQWHRTCPRKERARRPSVVAAGWGEPSIRHVTDGLSDGEWTWNIQSKNAPGSRVPGPVFAGWEMCEGSFCRPTLRHAKSPLKAPQGLSGHLGWRCGLSFPRKFLPSYAATSKIPLKAPQGLAGPPRLEMWPLCPKEIFAVIRRRFSGAPSGVSFLE